MKIESTVILGKEAVNHYEETGKPPSKKWVSEHSGEMHKRQFNTVAELKAYNMGLSDRSGYEDFNVLPTCIKKADCPDCFIWLSATARGNHFHYCPVCGKHLKEKPQIEFGSVTFQNRIYPTRTIDLPGYMDEAVISVEELNEFIHENEGKLTGSDAASLEAIDNSIFFYVNKKSLSLPNKKLARLVIKNLGGNNHGKNKKSE